MKMNPYFAELEKLANVDEALDPMNPDPSPAVSEEKVAEEQAKEADEAYETKKEEVEKKATEVQELEEKIAGALPEFGALAKLVEFSTGGEEVPETLQKRAHELLNQALTDEKQYRDVLTKVAHELFASQENVDALFSDAGVEFILDKLASLTEDEEFVKVANDGGGFLSQINQAFQDFKYAVGNVNQIKQQLEQAQQEYSNLSQQVKEEIDTNKGIVSDDLVKSLDGKGTEVNKLNKQLKMGQGGKAVGLAAAVGGAMYGGKKMYDAMHEKKEEKVASGDTEITEKLAEQLSIENGDVTLSTEYQISDGGLNKMSKELVRDFLKVAGAAALITIVNNESIDMEIRKEASDQFDAIANLGHKDMGEAFIKVAKELYTEPELHQIVAGNHTEELLGKVAFFKEAFVMSNDELEKIAGAGSVAAAKNVGAGLSDAQKNVEEHIKQDKSKTEGAGRQYVGTVKGAEGAQGGSGTGLVGGALGTPAGLAGYSVLNQPGKYDIEQTAAALEEAFLAKQAAADTYIKADAFIKQYAHLLRK